MQTEGQFHNMLGTIVIQIQTHEQFSRLELHVELNISYVQVKQPNSQHVKYSRDANIKGMQTVKDITSESCLSIKLIFFFASFFWSLILYNVTFNIELHDAIEECSKYCCFYFKI